MPTGTNTLTGELYAIEPFALADRGEAPAGDPIGLIAAAMVGVVPSIAKGLVAMGERSSARPDAEAALRELATTVALKR